MMHPTRRALLLAAWATTTGLPAQARTATHSPQDVLLAGLWADHLDPRHYLVSEKLDGVRALWDGQRLRFRSGRLVNAPAWFTQRLPNVALDGELWLGRGRFDALSAIVRSQTPADDAWRSLRYGVFELPHAPGSFSERAQSLQALAQQTAWPQLQAVAQQPVADHAALRAQLARVLAQGGEGLALHLADAPYQTGRSQVLLKLKPQLDAEATVLRMLAGQGKYAGQMGALWVRTPEGREFALGTGFSDALRRQPPAPGSVVTYRYRDLTASGLPRFASFMRVHDAM